MRFAALCLAGCLPVAAMAAPMGLSPELQLMPAQRISPLLLEAQPTPPAPAPRTPLIIAQGIEYSASSDAAGIWEQAADNRWVWRAVIHAQQAASLGISLRSSPLLEQASITAYDPAGDRVESLHARGELLRSPLIGGDTLVIEVALPKGQVPAPVEIAWLHYGFMDPATGRRTQKSGDCNVDVICPEGDAWRQEIQAVARYTFDVGTSTALCTGTLVNNTALDRRPLFLTANHCVSDNTTAQTMTLYWNFETSSCGGTPNGSLNQSQSGATLLATGADSDFTLVVLDSQPAPAFDVTYAGWDATETAACGVTAIHHPSGDEKRISFEYATLTQTQYSSNTPDASAQFWRVEDWDVGTTEGGSSGSGLWNEDHRIVGQLSGGGAACGNDEPDWYGRFSDNWDNGSPGNSLRPHLDPTGSGDLTLDGLDDDGNTITLNTSLCGAMSGGGGGGSGGGGSSGGGSSSGGDGGSGALPGWLLLPLLGLAAIRRRG